MAEPQFVTVGDFAEYLGRSGTSSTVDEKIAKRQLIAAENYVADRVPYDLGPSDGEKRTIRADGESFVRLPGGLRSATEVLIDGQPADVDVGYRLLGRRRRPYHAMLLGVWGAGLVEVTGDWGFEETPADLVNGILAHAARDHFIRLNRGADVTQTSDGAASSYYDRLPTVTRAAIENYGLPTL